MEENNKKINNISEENNSEHYSNVSGTGIWSSIVFTIVAIIAMYFLAKFMGS